MYIDWGTKIIHVMKSDMTLLQSTPITVYSLDMNWFRKKLNDLQDNEDGIVYPTTHIHYPPVSIGGTSLARVIEIINGYRVEFESGQYIINLTGANNNILDVVIFSGPSIASNNSAGLIEVCSGSLTPDIIEEISDKAASKTWEELTTNHSTPGTFGEYISKKLLSIKLWLTK